jgi:hypothetical protein
MLEQVVTDCEEIREQLKVVRNVATDILNGYAGISKCGLNSPDLTDENIACIG